MFLPRLAAEADFLPASGIRQLLNSHSMNRLHVPGRAGRLQIVITRETDESNHVTY